MEGKNHNERSKASNPLGTPSDHPIDFSTDGSLGIRPDEA